MAEDTPRSVPRGPKWVPTGPSELPTDPKGEPIDAPRFDLRKWDPGIPLLLLPVRLETKYASRDGGAELRIRIIPDTVSVQSAAPASAREIEEATDFWMAYHGATGAEERAAVWRQFVGRLGTNRAGYVARLTRPVVGAGGTLTFPEVAADAPTPGEMSLLPDRWLAFGWVGETLAFQQFGNPIAGPLAVSPDPTAPVTEVGRSGLRIDPATSWLFDYDEAVERGMAITVPLTDVAAKAADGVSTLVVVGIDAAQHVRETAEGTGRAARRPQPGRRPRVRPPGHADEQHVRRPGGVPARRERARRSRAAGARARTSRTTTTTRRGSCGCSASPTSSRSAGWRSAPTASSPARATCASRSSRPSSAPTSAISWRPTPSTTTR